MNKRNFIDGRTFKKYYCKEFNCSNEISYTNFQYGSKRCNSCSKKGKRNPMYNKKGKLSPVYIDGRSSKSHYCINCKKEISFVTWHYSKLCNSCCRIGEKNSNWRNGSSCELYPLGWNKTFKEQIRYRDRYICQLCGDPEIECRRKLDVHHIDYDKKNISTDNLVSLCQSCHMKTNYNRKYWTVYFKEAIQC